MNENPFEVQEDEEGEEGGEVEEMHEKRDQLYSIINKFKDNLENIEKLELPDAQYFKGFYENIQNMKAFSLDQFQEPVIIDQQLLNHVMTVDQLDEFISKKENIQKIHSNYNNHAQNINVVISASNADIDEKRLVDILESKDEKIVTPSEFSKETFVPPKHKSLTIDLGSNVTKGENEDEKGMNSVSVTIKFPNSPDVNVETYLTEMLRIRGKNSFLDRMESEFNANFRVSSRMSEDRLYTYISLNGILTSQPDENTIRSIQEWILTGIRGIQLSDIDDKRLNSLILSKIKSDKVEIDTYSHYLKNLSMDLYNYNAGYAMYNQDANGVFDSEDDYATAVKKILNDISYDNIFFSSSSFHNGEKKEGEKKEVFQHNVQGLRYNIDNLTEEQDTKFKEIMEVPSLHVLENKYNINIKRENKYLDKYIEPRFYSSKDDKPLYTETVNTPSGTKVNVTFRPSIKAPDGAQQRRNNDQNAAAVLSFKSKAFSKIYNCKGSGELGRMFFREIASNILFRAHPEYEMFQEAGVQVIPLPNLVDDSISVWIMADRQHLKDVCSGLTKAIFSPVNTKLFTFNNLLENVKLVSERRSKPVPMEHFENIRAQTRLGFDDHFRPRSQSDSDIAAELFKIWNEEVVNAKLDEVNISIHMDYRKEQMEDIGEGIGENLPNPETQKDPETGEDIEISYEGLPSISDSYDSGAYLNKLRDDNKELKGTCVVETLNPALPNPFHEVIAILEQKNPTNADIYNSAIFDTFIRTVIPQKQEQPNQMDMMMGKPAKPPKNIYGLKIDNRLTQIGRLNGELYSSLILPFSAQDIIYLERKTKSLHELNKKVTCDDLILNFEQMMIENLIKPVLETPDDPKVEEMNRIFNESKSEFLDSLNDPEGAMQLYIEDVYAVQTDVFDQYDGISEYMKNFELKDLCVWLKDRIQNMLFVKINSVVAREEGEAKMKKPEFNKFMNSDVKVYNHVSSMKSYLDDFLVHVKEEKDPEFQERLAGLLKQVEESYNNAPKIFANSTKLRETSDINLAEYNALLQKADEDAQLEMIREGDKKHGVDTGATYEQIIEAMKKDPEAFRLNTERPTEIPKEEDNADDGYGSDDAESEFLDASKDK